MLQSLFLKNYVLFDEVQLNFERGFNVLTGDTGAGKSLIIDALGYLTGNRLNTDVVRKGSEKALIEGVFVLENKNVIDKLKDAGFEEEDHYIVSREITSDGRSTSRINHRTVTLTFIKELFKHELDIHGQRDTQYLLHQDTHLELVDEYAKNNDIKLKVKEKYNIYRQAKQEYQDLLNSSYNEDEIDFFRTQIEEIEDADVSEEEYDSLIERKELIDSYEDIFTALNNLRKLFNQQSGVVDSLYEADSFASELLSYDEYKELMSRIQSSYLEVLDINDELASQLTHLEFDEYELNQIESRLYTINHLIRKHGGTFTSLLENYERMQESIEGFDQREFLLEKYKKIADEKLKDYQEVAYELRASRNKTIPRLEKEVLKNLKELELDKARFAILMNDQSPQVDGMDEVQFAVSMNPGADLKPLDEVASGGELSRLMLGLKVIFSELFGVSTVIFDEIDTGVSGSVGSAIGVKMATLAKSTQVFSVTHLAQVAACSDYHYYVSKEVNENITNTSIELVTGKKQLEHLAFLATGSITPATLSAAEELFDKSQKLVGNPGDA